MSELINELSMDYFRAWILDMIRAYESGACPECGYWDLFGAWVGGGPL